jgi:fumarate reductase subunit C
MPADWWLKKRAYFLFMMRELSAVFVGAYAVLLLVMLWKLKQGPQAYTDFVAFLRTPVSIAFHIVALAAAIYNSITTFNAIPQVMPIRQGEEKLPGAMMVAPNYVAVVVVSVAILWVLGRGA